jgi:DNA-binding MarR family transcriptional regulator
MEYISKRKCARDNRSFNIFILPKADAIKDRVQKCWKESQDLALYGISESEQQYLLEIIGKIENNILINLKYPGWLILQYFFEQNVTSLIEFN